VTLSWVEDERVVFARSRNRGRNFGATSPIDAGDAAQWKPALAQGRGDVVHAAFIDERETGLDDLPQAHLYYSRIEEGTPTESERLDTGEPALLATKLDHSWAPSIASHGDRVLATWIDFLNYDWDVFRRLSTDGGRTWHEQELVNDTPEEDEELADTPRASLARDRELIAWTDWRKRDSSATQPHQMYDIFISDGGGENLQVDPYATRQLSTFAPDVCAVGRRGALVAFQDASRGQNDIRAAFVRGRKPGKARRVDDVGRRGGNAWRPRLGCSRRRALVLWEDERDGPAQIYFARAKLRRLR
jgi:hypothetical protein